MAPASQRWLLASARQAVAQALGVAASPPGRAPDDPQLTQPVAVFVSWHEGPRLVGCIGTLQPGRSLREAVVHYAVQAGLHDARTPMPLPDDLPRLSCEISVLSPPEPMDVQGLGPITAALVPGRDGLVLREGERRAVFLPVVWQSLPTREAFVDALCTKAGIDARRHGARVKGERFFAERFSDASVS
ncbi:MAG: AmmeMemoRadiSam system protein A [Deltaproteobacteria bacterium]|nr:AmmeMemoRadiSam system protein A [Deltaproteobacteria bacterium]